jgi:hypothetical protein
MTLTSGAGKLHGTWQYEASLTSDRRLKNNVEPLVKEILRHNSLALVHVSSASAGASRQEQKYSSPIARSIQWLNDHSHEQASSALSITESRSHGNVTRLDDTNYLPVVVRLMRQLRPVSFRYKNNAESKHSRYGFIAQELESLVPSVIYSDGSSGLKFIRYHDLLAVVTMGMQVLDSTVAKVEYKLSGANSKIVSDYGLLSPRVRVLENALVELLKSSLSDPVGVNDNYSEAQDLNYVDYMMNVSGNMSTSRSMINWNYTTNVVDSDSSGKDVISMNLLTHQNTSSLDAYLTPSKSSPKPNRSVTFTTTNDFIQDSRMGNSYDELISELYSLVEK